MKKIVLILFFTGLFSSLNGQILNIERLRIEKDTAKNFMFKTTFGLNVFNRSAAADAPVNLFGYNFDLNTLYFPKKHAFILVSKFDYLRINDSDFLNFGYVHGRANFLREEKVNYETFVQYSFDNFRGLDPRWLAGGSVRIYLVKNDRISFIVGMGGFYEREKWMHPFTEESVEVKFVKSSNYFSLRATINEFVDINTINYYQVGYDNSINDFRHRLSTSFIINTKLTDRFSFTNSIDIGYEDKPIVPITRLIFGFKTGLSLDF